MIGAGIMTGAGTMTDGGKANAIGATIGVGTAVDIGGVTACIAGPNGITIIAFASAADADRRRILSSRPLPKSGGATVTVTVPTPKKLRRRAG